MKNVDYYPIIKPVAIMVLVDKEHRDHCSIDCQFSSCAWYCNLFLKDRENGSEDILPPLYRRLPECIAAFGYDQHRRPPKIEIMED
jgi:hypothetical protein